MKRIFTIVLVLALVLSYSLVTAAPVAASSTTWYVIEGGAGDEDGSDWDNAFDSIQKAIDKAQPGDTILVGPGTYDEFIDIYKPLTVISSNGTAVTTISPTTPPAGGAPGQVVLISADDVVFGGAPSSTDHGFTVKIDGYVGEGLFAPDTAIAAYNVGDISILYNIVEIDGIEEAYGIYAVSIYGTSLIDHNTVTLGGQSISYGEGIHAEGEDTIIISNNQVQAGTEDGDAYGILVDGFYMAKVLDNVIDVTAAGEDVWISGIELHSIGRAQVRGNNVSANASGEDYAGIDGIGLYGFKRAKVSDNTVSVDSSVSGASRADAWGIYLDGYDAKFAEVMGNTIIAAVYADGEWGYLEGISAYGIWQQVEIADNTVDASVDVTGAVYLWPLAERLEGLPDRVAKRKGERLEDMAQARAELREQTLGIAQDTEQEVFAQGEGYGITAAWNGYVNIHLNEVTLVVNVEADASAEEYAYALVSSWAAGLHVYENFAPQVKGNNVSATADLILNAEADGATEASRYGYAEAYGILLEDNGSDETLRTTVDGNSVVAEASLNATLSALSTPPPPSEEESLLSRMWSQMNAVHDAAEEMLAAVADVSPSAGPQPLAAYATGQGLSWAFGIYAYNCPGIQITNNDPATGRATAEATITATEGAAIGSVEGSGYVEAGGLGIFVWNPYEANIAGNNVNGSGDAHATILAEEVLVQYTSAQGGAVAYGYGICAYSWWGYDVAVSDNNVVANADALTTVASLEEVADENDYALGASTAYAIGISLSSLYGWWWGSYLISDNAVAADSTAVADIAAESVSSDDPYAEGYGSSTAIGIYTYGGYQNQILDNTPVAANAHAKADVSAHEEQMALDVAGEAGSSSTGVGISAQNANWPIIRGNDAQGSSSAETIMVADSSVPLDWAEAYSYADSFGCGLLLQWTNEADVTWNSFLADASVAVEATAGATFEDEWTLGYSLATDIANYWSWGSRINYNDIGNGVGIQTEYGQIEQYRYGLFNQAGEVNARYNWWGDPSGPSGRGLGIGAAIEWEEGYEPVPYEWWLSHPIGDLLEDSVGYFGFAVEVVKGWNTLSTPIALENPGFEKIAAIGDGLDWAIAYYYDPTKAMPWQQVLSGFNLYPLEGIYLKMNADDAVFFTTSPATHAPLRNLSKGQSWYLIGPTPYGDDFPFTTDMPVDLALVSLEETPGGNRGYNQVVSPSIGGQLPWAYVPGMSKAPMMVGGKAYWVFMENADTLAGFIFTPLPVDMPLWPPQPAAIGYWPEALTFTIPPGQDWTETRWLYVYNDGDGALQWWASDDASWLNLNPTTGTATRDDPTEVQVRANTLGLSPGTYTATITITAPEAVNTPQQIPVVLHVIDWPAITTLEASNITSTSATLNAMLDSMGNFSEVEVRFEWEWRDPEWGWQWAESDWQTMTGVGAFAADLSDLNPDTTYYFHAVGRVYWPQYGYYWVYGGWREFTTDPSNG